MGSAVRDEQMETGLVALGYRENSMGFVSSEKCGWEWKWKDGKYSEKGFPGADAEGGCRYVTTYWR